MTHLRQTRRIGPKETVQAGIASGLAAIGNVKRTATYKASAASPSYTPATGAVTRLEQDYTVSGLVYGYARRDIDGVRVKPFDRRFLCQQADLPVSPKLTERLVLDGQPWEVVGIEEDPAQAVWMLQIRGAR
jgi:hypothetical protein